MNEYVIVVIAAIVSLIGFLLASVLSFIFIRIISLF
jgi:hypothetical protein